MWTLIFILLFSTLFKSCSGRFVTVPVLLIDHDNVMSRLTVPSNPFMLINGPFFNEIASDAMKRSECVVIFIEEQLSVEDLRSKDKLGTPYNNLRLGINGTEVIFLPTVIEPYQVLTKVFEPHPSNTFFLGKGDKLLVLEQHKYVYVFFNENEEMTRIENLRKHDMLIKEAYFTVRLKKAGPVVAFYTGKVNPMPSEKLRARPVQVKSFAETRGTLLATPDALFRLTDILITKRAHSFIEDYPEVTSETRTDDSLSTTMQISDFNLQFNFVFGNNHWKLDNVALLEAGETVGRTLTDIQAPWQRSYYCNQPITILNQRDGSMVTLSEYQIEPKKTSALVPRMPSEVLGRISILMDNTFNNPDKCCPYFNHVILSGLFVTALFMAITTWGVLMLFNCHTGDQFDDPNQKQLVIACETSG